jgi:hypothetical protein
MSLLSKLGIEHSVLRDKDPNNQLHAEINQLIANSLTQFTVTVEEIDPDLEGFLDLPNPGRNDRKPQNAIYAYMNGDIDVTKLANFCTIVNKILA